MVDIVIDTANRKSKAELKLVEQELGIKYNPAGVLQDQHLRTIVRPIDHYVRDPMHTLVSGGVCGTQIALLFSAPIR